MNLSIFMLLTFNRTLYTYKLLFTYEFHNTQSSTLGGTVSITSHSFSSRQLCYSFLKKYNVENLVVHKIR